MFIWLSKHLAATALALVTCFALPATASAHNSHMRPGWAVQHSADALAQPASCPAGVPVQDITLVSEASPGFPLLRFENAMVAQSLQLRSAWGTPCVQFGTSGWPLYLVSDAQGLDLHYAPDSVGDILVGAGTACSNRPDIQLPCALVSITAQATTQGSHELMEMLADPSDTGTEVCDPVEGQSYLLQGVRVSDFITPAGHSFRP